MVLLGNQVFKLQERAQGEGAGGNNGCEDKEDATDGSESN